MKSKKHSKVRGFERDLRLQALLGAGLLTEAGQIPDNALPASVAAAERTGRLFYQDEPFRCRDCSAECVWTGEEQRFWFERVNGDRYGRATRCAACRRRLKEARK